MLIDISSWKRSLQAYGIRMSEIWEWDKSVSKHSLHLPGCFLIKDYWLDVWPVSCCGSLDTRTCVSSYWRWPSVRTGYTRGLDKDPMPQRDALWGTEQHREQFDSHAPSHQNADRHHWEKRLKQGWLAWGPEKETLRNRESWDWPWTSFHWLSVQDLNWTPGSGVDLIVHHVLETLIICWTNEDLWRQLPPSEAIIQNLRRDQNSNKFICRQYYTITVNSSVLTSFPLRWYPYSASKLETFCTLTASLKGVASPISPLFAETCKKKKKL